MVADTSTLIQRAFSIEGDRNSSIASSGYTGMLEVYCRWLCLNRVSNDMKAKHKSHSAKYPGVPGFTHMEEQIETFEAVAAQLSVLMEVDQMLEPKAPHALKAGLSKEGSVLMDVEQMLELKGPHPFDAQLSSERLKCKMRAQEEVLGESHRKVTHPH